MKANRGMSLIELVVALGVGGIALLLSISAFRWVTRGQKTFESALQTQASATELVSFIQHLGRAARSCSKVVVSGNPGLQCDVDFGKIATLQINRIRLLFITDRVEEQRDTSPDGSFSTFEVAKTFPGVKTFTLCDDTDMRLSAGGTCPLLPLDLSRRREATATARPNRFFRFGIALADSEQAFRDVALQGSFFVRNPIAPRVFVQW